MQKEFAISLQEIETARPRSLFPPERATSNRAALEAANERAVHAMRAKCFAGVVGVGAACGAVRAMTGEAAASELFFSTLTAMVLVMLAGFIGGLAGDITRGMAAWVTGGDVEGGDTTDGMIVGGFGFAFLGFVMALVFWQPERAGLFAAVGAFAGGFLGALPGEQVGVIVRMLAAQEQRERIRQDI